jgi:hypothetical protein
MRRGGAQHVIVVPNGTDAVPRQPIPWRSRHDPLRILFVGAPYLPNRLGVEWLIADVLPAVRARIPVGGFGARGPSSPAGPARRPALGLRSGRCGGQPRYDRLGLQPEAGRVPRLRAAGRHHPRRSAGFEGHAAGVTVAEPDHFAAAIAGAALHRAPRRAVQDLSWDSLARRLHGVYARLLGT